MDEGAERRENRRFEPPPWEKDRFDELARQKEPEQAEEGARSAPSRGTEAAGPGTEEGAPAPGPLASSPEGEESAPKPGPDAAAFDSMMFDLRLEEPSAGRPTWVVRVVVAVFMLVLGAVLMLWGMVGLVKVLRTAVENRSAGLLVSGTLLGFGVVFISLAGWAGYTAYQKRGVR